MKSSTLILLLCATCLGCFPSGNHVRQGIHAYERKDYAGVLQEMNQVEDPLLTRSMHVRYLAYTGLSLYHLGRKDEADKVLGEALAAYEAGDPDWLSERIRDELRAALADLKRKK